MADFTLTYPGVTSSDVLGFSGTAGVDDQPARFTLTVQRDTAAADFGTLAFSDGVRTVTLPGCRRTDARWVGGNYQVTIEDRRWRWRTGTVFGRYNKHLISYGYEFIADHKTPRELAELLWAEMNETALDVSLLPNDAAPHVDWYAANAADELIALLAQFGCLLAPKLNGDWKVWPIGTGEVFTPPAGYQVSSDLSQTFAVYPDQVAAVAGPTQYEVVFALEAVGEDEDGSIKPIDDLSYTPAGGWETVGDDFTDLTGTYTQGGKTLNHKDLARSCVRRWYRIASMPAGTGDNSLNPPGYPSTLPPVDSLARLLPLTPLINYTGIFVGDLAERLPARVWGEFEKDRYSGAISRPGTPVSETFSLDAERGIVKFPRPVRRVINHEEIKPAVLYLDCVVEVDQPDLNVPAFYVRSENTGLNNGTGAETIERDDLALWFVPEWNDDGTAVEPEEGEEYPSNRQDLDAELDYYVAAKMASYQSQSSGTLRVAGIHAPELNGVQTSVSWSAGVNRAPMTTVGVGSRANPFVPDYKKNQAEKQTKSQQRRTERRERLKARGLFRGQP